MPLIVSLLTTVALAQGTTGGDLPEINSQLYRPPVDATRTLWTDDTSYSSDLYTTGRVFFSYADDPFIYTRGGTVTTLVDNVLQADLIGSVSYQRVRIGVDLPVFLLAEGETVTGNNAGLGDISLDVKGTLLTRESSPLGLAVAGRMGLPTSTNPLPLGDAGLGGELSVIADKEIGGLLLAGNLGTRFLPEVEMENITLDDAFVFRVGAGYAFTDNFGLSFDLAGQPNYANDGALPAPLEGLFGGWGRVSDFFMLRGGVGTGFTDGIGSPSFRAVLALTYDLNDERDQDRDGLIDVVDDCPKDPEDLDGHEDTDGCPDPSTHVIVQVIDALNGEPVQGAAVVATSPEGEGGASLFMHPGELSVVASAEDYLDNEAQYTIPEQETFEAQIQLQPMGGTVKVRVIDGEGNPIEGYTWLIDNALQEDAESFARVGEREVVVRASGFKPQRRKITLAHEEVVELEFILESSQVKVTQERIEVDGKVYFDTDKATIKPESFDLLNEVAESLKAHPEITKLKIEGHADYRGEDDYNLWLSNARAASVRQFLIDAGVEAERMESEGFGETRPIADNSTAEGREKNRRVDFFIKARVENFGQQNNAQQNAERQTAPASGEEAGQDTEEPSAPEAAPEPEQEATQDAERQGGE